MPRYNIQHPETKQWACFSTVVDEFICDWMDRDKYIEWLLKEERERINYILDRSSRFMSYEDCLKTIEWRKYCKEMAHDDDGSTVVEDYNRIFKHSGKKGGETDE